MIAFFLGLVVGFLMCIPVGPINISVLNTYLKHNFKLAFSIALGGSLMDFIYFMLILTGFSLVTFGPKTILTLKVLGVLFIFFYGLKELISSAKPIDPSQTIEKKEASPFSYFLLGMAIYSSNPTLIATMSGLVAVIKSWRVFEFTFLNYFLLSLGLSFGSALWMYFLLFIVKKYQKKMTDRFFANFNRGSGILMIGLSFIMAFKIYREMSL